MVKVPAASRERHAPKGQKTETGDKTVGYPRPVWRLRRRSGTIFWAIDDARAAAGSGKGAVYGLGAHPGLRHRGGGPRAAGAERISGHRKPHSEGAVERAAEALRRRASHAWRDRSSLGPQ